MGDREQPFRPRDPRGLVFTSREVMNGELPILVVDHYPDGDWMFVAGGEVREDCANLVPVHPDHVVEWDPSVLEVADLPAGWWAFRDTTDSPWEREFRGG